MKLTHAIAIILAVALTLTASFSAKNTVAAQIPCTLPLTHNTVGGNGSFVDTWINDESIDCPSVHRLADEDAPGDGRYLARYYTFSLSELADVTITLESPIDTYLYLLEGAGMDGAVLHKNDDIDRDNRNFNSRIQATLDAGDYTIEATTYDAVYPTHVVEFRLTVSGITPQSPADGDRAALIALYNATNGPNWRRSANWLTDAPLSEWHGVTTDADGRVTGLDLERNDIDGEMPPEIGNLASLERLDLRVNDLSGEIPSELGSLTSLISLSLDFNELTGVIPREIGNLASLELLDLSNNDLSGEMPSELGSLTNLISLSLDFNELTGRIPPALGEIVNLEQLRLNNNNLSGTIPLELAKLSNLKTLSLRQNELTGDIPPWIGDLSNLESLGLHANNLAGEIPAELANLTKLEFLGLHANNLTGEIPAELANLTKLKRLHLHYNYLSGKIPPELGTLTNLGSLNLSGNNLIGEVPSEFSNLANLQNLALSNNLLTGTLPQSLTALTSLTEFFFGHNAGLCAPADESFQNWLLNIRDLEGSACGVQPMPSAQDDIDALTALYNAANGDNWERSRNWLTDAPVSKWYGITTDAEGRVARLGLDDNNLSGTIPPELGSIANMESLILSDNQLTGEFPPELTKLTELTRLYFYNNAGLCAPAYAAFQNWLESVIDVHGPTCEDAAPPPPDTTSAECTQHISAGAPANDAWTDDCISQNRTENGTHYAKYYTYTIDRRATIDLTLESPTDTYLILLSESGDIIKEDDDDDDGVFDLRARSSGIRITLDPGSYTVEATTYAGAVTDNFTLTIIRPELTALHALYNATDGANWTNSDNWLTDAPLSDWHGIKTDDEGRVTEIYLISNNLIGEIPSELGQLGHLQGLYLARNDLSGSIPAELANLSSLRTLMLFDNELTGAIPYQLGNLGNLEEIHLGRNQLSGRIPTQLGNLENLRRLHLTVNELSGSIPASLGSLSNLRQLSIAANDLTGSIPTEIADLENLTHIYLWGNDLSAGAFVSNMDNLTNLQWLDIGGNRLDGNDVLPKISSLTKLTGLGLHDSGLTDADLHDYMADLEALNLEFLNISGNDLSDPQTLIGLSRITTIQRLAINNNDFSGKLPRTMTRLTLMRLFYFHDNDGLCAPADNEFQDWLTAIRDVRGDTCAGGTPAHAPAPASNAADKFAAIIQSPENLVQPHSISAFTPRPRGGG